MIVVKEAAGGIGLAGGLLIQAGEFIVEPGEEGLF